MNVADTGNYDIEVNDEKANAVLLRCSVTKAGAAGLGAAGAAHASLLAGSASQPVPPRKFYVVLSLGRIGFKGTFQQSVELATHYGFEGVDPDAEYFSQLSDDQLKKLLDELKAKNLKLGAAGLPVEFRKDEQTFAEDLKKLPATAKVLEAAGVTAGEHMDCLVPQ